MRALNQARVRITEDGRSGSVVYQDAERRITGWWEFAGGDALAIVWMGRPFEWQPAEAWPPQHRAAVLRLVADEVIRQKCAGCVAEIDEDSGWITIRR